MKLKQT